MAESGEEEVKFEGLNCSRCHFELDEPFVCKRVECLTILCSICRSTHEHAESVIPGADATATIRPFIENYRKSIKECVTKTMSRRAKSEFEAMTRLDRSAEVKKQIRNWCVKMRRVIDVAEETLVTAVEAMEDDFKFEADTLIKELQILERDYKNVNDLKIAFNENKLPGVQAFKLFALMKKYEESLADPSKTSEKHQWEQTYLSFIPNEEALKTLRSTAYVCGKIKSNIQLLTDTEQDKSGCGISGMTLIGDRIAVADKFNRSLKIFTRPLNCGLGGESVETTIVAQYEVKENTYGSFVSPGDLVYDAEKNLLIVTDEQDGYVRAVDPETGKLDWQIEVQRPNGIALTDKLIVVCSEYEKRIITFKRKTQKYSDTLLLKDHPLSIAANTKGEIAVCTIHGRMSILNSSLKEQHVVHRELLGGLFQPQRVCVMYNDRFLACDTQRVLEIEPTGVAKRTILVSGMPGTSIPGLPAALCCDQHRNIFMAFSNYVKVFPVPLEIVPPEESDESSASGTGTSDERVAQDKAN